MEPTTFLVREKGLNPKAFGLYLTCLFRDRHIGHQIQRVFLAFRPTTDDHNGSIRRLCKARLRAGNEQARLETRP
jgi:hypothetical protein